MYRFFYILLGSLLLVWSCDVFPLGQPEALTLMTWNIQNIFDDVKDGGEYPEFDPDRGWNRKSYWNRLERCAGVIDGAGPRLPDLVFLQEVENSGVLETLRTRFLDPGWYSWSLLVPDPGSAVQVGVLSRWPLVRSGVHRSEGGRTGGRPVLEVRVLTPWGEVTFFNNHWKSRQPDRDTTEPARIFLAGLLAHRMKELEAQGEYYLALGDFNTYPEPGLPGALGYGAMGAVSLCDPGTAGKTIPGHWDDIWNHVEEMGSYYYRGQWEPLDHIIFPPRDGVEVAFQVLSPPGMVGPGGVPLAWSPRNPQGVSDHLPLWAEIRFP